MVNHYLSRRRLHSRVRAISSYQRKDSYQFRMLSYPASASLFSYRAGQDPASHSSPIFFSGISVSAGLLLRLSFQLHQFFPRPRQLPMDMERILPFAAAVHSMSAPSSSCSQFRSSSATPNAGCCLLHHGSEISAFDWQTGSLSLALAFFKDFASTRMQPSFLPSPNVKL